jgi:hypothetical protein
LLKLAEDAERSLPVLPANQFLSLEINAYFGSLFVDSTAVIFAQMDTFYPRRFAARHARNRR